MSTDAYTIRPMTPEDLTTIVGWAAAEGWNPGRYDADCFRRADPGGFFVGVSRGEAIASISAVRYGTSYGFIGFYIVRPEYRGQGYGLRIWKAGLDYLKGRSVGLDGVVAQQPNYRKSGFQWAYANIRYRAEGRSGTPNDTALVPVSALPFETLLAYDRALVPDDREGFLRCWIVQPESQALALMEAGSLRGYGMIRPSHEGYRIGPLFADDGSRAERLLLGLLSRAEPGAPVFVDMPSANPAAVELARRYGMEPGFETARMYAGGIPDLPVERIFGVTSLELG